MNTVDLVLKRDFDEIKREIRTTLASISNLERHRQNLVLQAGNLLVELQPIYCAKYRINVHGGPLPPGVLSYREWACKEFGISVNTVAEYMMIARSKEPEKRLSLPKKLVSIGRQVVRAVEDIPGEDNRGIVKVDRAKILVQHIAAQGYMPPGATALDTAKAAFRALDDKQRAAFMAWVAEWFERHNQNVVAD